MPAIDHFPDRDGGFRPKHVQPFTLAQAVELEVPLLATEITRLENSITHLRVSNDEIRGFLAEEEDEEDREEFQSAIRENEDVISAQTERIQIIRLALARKLGGEQASSLEHYGFAKGTVEGVLRGPADGQGGRQTGNSGSTAGGLIGTDEQQQGQSGIGQSQPAAMGEGPGEATEGETGREDPAQAEEDGLHL